MPKDVLQRKLRSIFLAYNARIEQREREAEAEKKRQFDNVTRMHDHLSKVVVPCLRVLAANIELTGQKVTVVETGPMGSPETSSAHVKLTVIPRGYETADPNDLPRLLFQSGAEGIVVTCFAYFPGRGGESTTSAPFKPAGLGPDKVELLLVDLVERTFKPD